MPFKLHGVTIDDYKVSRQEEAEALAYIKKYIVSEAVEFFEVNKALYGKRKDDIVDSNKVARSLRKVQHHRAGKSGNPTEKDNWIAADWIVYEGYDSTENAWPPTTFQFVISKNYDEYGSIFLEAGYNNPLRKGQTTINIIRRTKHYPMMEEGRNTKSKFGKYPQLPLLSQREKDEAFYNLKLRVVSKAVNNVNAYLTGIKGMDTPHVTVEEALKTIRQKSDDGNIIIYQSEIPGKAIIKYIIEKKNPIFSEKPIIYIGFYSPETKQPYQVSMDSGKPSLAESFSQQPEPPKPVTKKEEMMVLNLLKSHYQKEFPEIGKYLKRTGITPSIFPEDSTDKLQYEYNDGKQRALFSIHRTVTGLWIMMWEWGNNDARDHLHVNVLSQIHPLQEAFEKPIFPAKGSGLA